MGSSSYITDVSGKPCQYLEYLPFGEVMVQQSTNNIFENVYKFNGKELDESTGYYYYGARYYDPGASVFLSVDPLAEDFPNWTPYHYVHNNPINLIDPTGMSAEDIIIIRGKDEVKYENGNLFNKDGSGYTGNVNGFLKKTVDALGEISKSSEGAEMISELQSSDNVFTISEGKSQFSSSNKIKACANQIATDPMYESLSKMDVDLSGGSGGAIEWNTSGRQIPTISGNKRNSITDLAHEMFHGLDANRGMLDDRKEKEVKRSEWQATYRENNVRSQLNIPLGTHYQPTISQDGVQTGSGNRMLNPMNINVKPIWY